MSAIKLEGFNQAMLQLRGMQPKLTRAARLAINTVARRTRTEGGRKIREQVNLPARYVNENLTVRPANETTLEASINATKRPVLLTRYRARQLTRKAKGASRGDASRGILPGRKAAGVSVRVKRKGAPKRMRGAFFIRLRAGRDRQAGAMGVAVRTGRGRQDYKVLHGPSVDQTWRSVREDVAPDVGARLAAEFQRQLTRLTR